MKRIAEKKINIINKYKLCPYCRAKLKDIKVYDSPNVRIERPVFSCNCLQKEYEIKEMQMNESKYRQIMDESRIDFEFRYNDFEIDREEFREYYDDLSWLKRGENILVYGMPGNHKTGNVCLIARQAAKKLYTVLYMRASKIPDIFINDKRMKSFAYEADLVIVDNLGKHRVEVVGDLTFNFFDYRIHNKKSIIGITNGGIAEVADIYDPPMMSRLRGEDFKNRIGPIGEEGQDLRRGKTKK